MDTTGKQRKLMLELMVKMKKSQDASEKTEQSREERRKKILIGEKLALLNQTPDSRNQSFLVPLTSGDCAKRVRRTPLTGRS